MSDTYPNQSSQKHSNLAIILILLFPIVINSVKIVSNLILLILTVLGIYIVITEKKNPFKIKELKLFSWLMVGYFGVILLTSLMADGLNYEFHHLGRKLQFLLAPLIALSIFQVNFSLKNLLLSIKIGLIIIGIITMIQFQFHLGEEWWRPSGMMNQNIFGDIAVAMLFLSMVQFFDEKPKEQIITLIAIIAGIVAIVLSASRGSWISAIILSIVYLSIIYKPYLYSNTKRKLSILGVLIIIFTLLFNTQIIQNKVSKATEGVKEWSTGNSNSSTGERLNMWVSGLKAAQESPWIGHGYRKANQAAQKYSDRDISYTHLHNEYITNLVSAGIVGLLSLLALIFIPMTIFYQKLKSKENYHHAFMGVLLCTGYATFGLTHIAFGEEHINAFYVLFMGLLLPKVIKG
jgi:O-antigen ligase